MPVLIPFLLSLLQPRWSVQSFLRSTLFDSPTITRLVLLSFDTPFDFIKIFVVCLRQTPTFPSSS